MPTRRPTLLLVDDNPNDTELTLAAIQDTGFAGEIVVVPDGDAALDFLRVRGPFAGRAPGLPVLVVLDVLMPRVHGLEVLRQIRADPATHRLPVIVTTGVKDPADAFTRYESAQTAFHLKPLAPATLVATAARIGCPLVPAAPADKKPAPQPKPAHP